MTQSRNAVCRRLVALGHPKVLVHRVLNYVDKLIRHNGVSWTVSRLKTMKAQLVSTVANVPVEDRSWISWRGGAPRGPLRQLFIGLDNPKRAAKAINSMMIYTSYVHPENRFYPDQARKWLKDVQKTPSHNSYAEFYEDCVADPKLGKAYAKRLDGAIGEMAKRLVGAFVRTTPDTPDVWLWRKPFSKHPKITKGLAEDGVENDDGCLSTTFQYLFADSVEAYRSLIWADEESRLSERLKDSLDSWSLLRRDLERCLESNGTVGRIDVIQEPGLKARVVAHVHPLYQILTSHLGKALWRVVRSLPEDGAFDQNQKVRDTQGVMREAGMPLSSIDMSAATDNFPYFLQEEILKRSIAVVERKTLHLRREIQGLEELYDSKCRDARDGYLDKGDFRKWEYEYFHPAMSRKQKLIAKTAGIRDALEHQVYLGCEVLKGRYVIKDKDVATLGLNQVSWECGQPMGSYLSFPLFSLAHHCLVRAAQPSYYAILGDDLVLTQDGAELHALALEKLAVPWSKEKSLWSSTVACEFAGKIITRERIIPQIKCKLTSDDNFLEQARYLGPKSIGLFRLRQRRVIQFMAHIMPELSPQGLGWNPKGLPYPKRVSLSELFESARAVETTKIPNDTRKLRRSMVMSGVYKASREFSIRKDLYLSEEPEVPAMENSWVGLDDRLRYYPISDHDQNTQLESLERKISSLDRDLVKEVVPQWGVTKPRAKKRKPISRPGRER